MKSRNQSRKRGFLRTLTALSVLLIFPFISYIFLQYGFNFRKNMIADLGEYGQWYDTTLVDACCPQNDLQSLLAITWHQSFNKPGFVLLANELDSLFASGEKIRILHIEDGSSFQQLKRDGYSKSSFFTYPAQDWKNGFAQDSIFQQFKSHMENGSGSAILVEEGLVRRLYDLSVAGEKERFLEHIVALLPKQEKRREVPYKQLQIDQK